jgi:hypothetical protein
LVTLWKYIEDARTYENHTPVKHTPHATAPSEALKDIPEALKYLANYVLIQFLHGSCYPNLQTSNLQTFNAVDFGRHIKDTLRETT